MDRKASADFSWKKNGTLIPLYLRPDGGGIFVFLLFVFCFVFVFCVLLCAFTIRIVVLVS